MTKFEGLRAGIGFAVLSTLIAIAGCQRQQGSGEQAPVADEPAASAGDQPEVSAVVEAARQDLAQRLNRPVEDVKLLENRPVYWKSAALGCPEPDKAYQQVLTRGWLIRLAVGRAEYRYHSGEDGPPFTCNPRQAEKPVPFSAD